MGCDIHSVAQVYAARKAGKRQWHTVKQDIAGDNRNYDTFASLADVRNGRGFASVRTGSGMLPMAFPRGLPEDFESDEDFSHPIEANTPTGNDFAWSDDAAWIAERLAAIAKETHVWMGDHSHSYATLAELRKHAARIAAIQTEKQGYVDAETFSKLALGEAPRSYSGGVSGGNVVTMPADEYRQRKDSGDLAPGKDYYVLVKWTANQLAETDIPDILADLEKVAAEHGVNEHHVRYVFGFDN